MTMAGSSEKQWRTDGIEPTYTTGAVFAWQLASRIELECEVDTPLVAWTLLVDHKSKSRTSPGITSPIVSTQTTRDRMERRT